MLVLTRKTQQQIHIGNNVVITILQVKGQNVRVGIEAPRDVRVVRAELKPKSIETGDGHSATSVTSTRQDTLPLPASTAHDDQPAAYDRNLREQSISTATVTAPVAVTRGTSDWSDRLAMRSFSRPDRRSSPTTLAGLVAARRNA
ncbi:MAG: carbon storage regulator [Planctomycetaceae bacterium]|nr:carbon storage regulator [Planctomycetaceae bacterium]